MNTISKAWSKVHRRSQLVRLAACAVLSLLSWSAVSVRADVGIVINDQSGQTYFQNSSVISKEILDTAWNAVRQQVCDQAIRQLGRGDLIRSGVTLYQITCSMATDGDFSATILDNQTLKLTYVLRQNYLEATSTTPTALGKYADPRFSVTYDLTATVIVYVPANVQPLSVPSAAISVSNANLDSHNFVGDVAFILGDIVRFFGGPNFKQQLEAAIDTLRYDFASPVNAALAPVNQVLQALAGSGFKAIQSAAWSTINQSPPNQTLSIVVYTPAPPKVAPQNCRPMTSCGGEVDLQCDMISEVVVLQRLDNGVWHDVSVDNDAARMHIPFISDQPGDNRPSASYRACSRNAVGDTCSGEIAVTFDNSSCDIGGGGGGGGLPGRRCGGFGQPACKPILYQ